MSAQPLVIASSANERYAVGLGVMMCSVLLCTKQETVRFHIMDDGITPETRGLIQDRVRRIADARRIRTEFNFIDFNQVELPELTLRYGSRTAYGRVFLPWLVDEPSLFYVDADILCNREFPLAEDMHQRFPDALIAGSLDPKGILTNDCPWSAETCPEELKLPYINTGFLWMNLEKLREFRMIEKFGELAGTGKEMRLADQTALNYLCRGRIGILPPEFNQVWNKSPQFVPRPHSNIHYVGKHKPWNSEPCASVALKIAHFNVAASLFGFPVTPVPHSRMESIKRCYRMKHLAKLTVYKLTGNPRQCNSRAFLDQWDLIVSFIAGYAAQLAADPEMPAPAGRS